MHYQQKTRCTWVNQEPLYIAYHDLEWGVPLHDENKLFEILLLEGMQAGLSWWTILRKRENFRIAFADFNAEKIARFSPPKLAKLLENPGIVRNRLKVAAAVANAKAFLKVQQEFDSFDTYIWQFVDYIPRQNHWHSLSQVPASTAQSDAMSRDLKRRGFKFVGSTICYAFMQAVGMVNDHIVSCYRHQELCGK